MSTFGIFFCTLEIDLNNFPKLDIFSPERDFFKDFDQKSDRFHEKDRILAKNMSAFGIFF